MKISWLHKNWCFLILLHETVWLSKIEYMRIIDECNVVTIFENKSISNQNFGLTQPVANLPTSEGLTPHCSNKSFVLLPLVSTNIPSSENIISKSILGLLNGIIHSQVTVVIFNSRFSNTNWISHVLYGSIHSAHDGSLLYLQSWQRRSCIPLDLGITTMQCGCMVWPPSGYKEIIR